MINKILFNIKMPLWLYSLLIWPLATLPSIALYQVAKTGFALAGLDPARFSPPSESLSFGGIIGTIIIAPVVETFVLALLLAILSSFVSTRLRIAIIAAVLSGLAHGLFGLLWFFGTVWSFFVLSCAYLAWREKGFKYAYIAALVPHVLNNGIATLIIFIAR